MRTCVLCDTKSNAKRTAFMLLAQKAMPSANWFKVVNGGLSACLPA